MKKIFLFGTALCIAGTAFAFGGILNHGSKSTTYKGGVDAIGVHFGGEKKTADSQPEEETCPAEKQCGDYCCGGDNVCKQDPDSGELQCCNDNIPLCCHNNQTAAMILRGTNVPLCCSGRGYCSFITPDGSCKYNYNMCCEDGQVYILAKLSYGTSYDCCQGSVHKGLGLDGADLCCNENQHPVCSDYDENKNCLFYICCASGETGYCSHRQSDGNCYSGNNFCCPAGSTVYHQQPDDICCAEGEVPVCTQFDGEMCQHHLCCPEGATSYCRGRDGSGHCYWSACCSGTVTRGEGTNPDTCDE